MKNFSLIKFIRSNNFALTCAILSVLVQSFHSFYAFYNMSSLRGSAWGVTQAILFSIVVDLAILFYTVRGKKDVVMFASVFLFIINGYYYYSHFGVSYELIFAGFLSVLIPVTQYYYSEEIKDDVMDVEYENPYDVARLLEDRDEDHTKEVNELKDKFETDRLVLTERIKELDGIIHNGMTENKRLCTRIDEEVAKLKEYNRLKNDRDGLVVKIGYLHSSNTKLSEILGARDREIFDLKKRIGDTPQDAELDPQAMAQEIQDKTLLNVQDIPQEGRRYINEGAYNPTTSVTPITE